MGISTREPDRKILFFPSKLRYSVSCRNPQKLQYNDTIKPSRCQAFFHLYAFQNTTIFFCFFTYLCTSFTKAAEQKIRRLFIHISDLGTTDTGSNYRFPIPEKLYAFIYKCFTDFFSEFRSYDIKRLSHSRRSRSHIMAITSNDTDISVTYQLQHL